MVEVTPFAAMPHAERAAYDGCRCHGCGANPATIRVRFRDFNVVLICDTCSTATAGELAIALTRRDIPPVGMVLLSDETARLVVDTLDALLDNFGDAPREPHLVDLRERVEAALRAAVRS